MTKKSAGTRLKKEGKVHMLQGFEVRDAEVGTVLTIPREATLAAAPHDPESCAVALGAKSSGYIAAIVGPKIVCLRSHEEPTIWLRYTTDYKSYKMIREFDADPEAVKRVASWVGDLTIVLKPPARSQRLGQANKPVGKPAAGIRQTRRRSLRNLSWLGTAPRPA